MFKPASSPKMVTKTAPVLAMLLVTALASAESVSKDDIVGVWDYSAYAAISAPDKRTPVGARIDIRPDGTVVTTRPTGEQVLDRYKLDGDILIYISARGEEAWKVRSFEPGKSLVLENRSTLMFWERMD